MKISVTETALRKRNEKSASKSNEKHPSHHTLRRACAALVDTESRYRVMADSTETSSEVPVPCLVTPGLWTCGESAVPSALLNLGITHLVSIGYPPPEDPCCGVKGVEVLCLELEDEDDGDLLTQIPTAVAFIQNGLAVFQAGLEGESIDDSAAAGHTNRKKTGGVLVHCHAGSSRSVAVAMAQVMRVSTMDVDTCLALVKKNNEHASPNEGFIAQLNLWHSMDCKLSTVNTAFKMYLTSKMQREREHNGYVESTSVRPDPGAPVNAPGNAASVTPFSGASAQTVAGPSEPNGGGPEAGVLIGCRKCRRLVARGANA